MHTPNNAYREHTPANAEQMQSADNEEDYEESDYFINWNNIELSQASNAYKEELTNISHQITLTKQRLEQRASLSAEINNQTCAKMNFLVYKCLDRQMCGGWGDRQKGIISVYLLALLTNRHFVIQYGSPCELTKFLIPKAYDWTLCSQYIRGLPSTEIQNMGWNNLKWLISNISSQNDIFTSPVVIVRTNQIWITQIQSHPKVAQMIPWAVGKTIPEVDGLVLSQLFQPSEYLAEGLKTFLDRTSTNKQLICTHLRMGKNPTIPKDNTRTQPDVIAIFEFLRQFDKSPKYSIYVASDSEEVRESVKGNFTNGYTVDLPIIHVDRYFKDQRSVACDGLYTVLLEQHILSSCDVLILTRSNLGAMAAYMSQKLQEKFIYFAPNQTILPVNVNEIQQYYVYK